MSDYVHIYRADNQTLHCTYQGFIEVIFVIENLTFFSLSLTFLFEKIHLIPSIQYILLQVLILLPDHVNIIMLSATVPNTLEFADWVGR